MTAKDKALNLCQKIGITTLFDRECNEGYTLPLHVSKKIALVAVDELIEAFEDLSRGESGAIHIDFGHGYWKEVKKEIEKL